jgi:hypothetical protein
MTVQERADLADVKKTIKRLAEHSDLGKRGRPGIKGTQPKLDAQVQDLLRSKTSGEVPWHPAFQINKDGVDAAVRLLEFKIREAYHFWEAV